MTHSLDETFTAAIVRHLLSHDDKDFETEDHCCLCGFILTVLENLHETDKRIIQSDVQAAMIDWNFAKQLTKHLPPSEVIQ